MRHRVRIQPYVLPATHRKLRAYAAAQNLTDSAVTEAALSEYLERDNFDEPLIVRRLDSVVGALAQLQSDVDIMSKGFGIFARYSFLRAQANTTAEERRRADDTYGAFLARISDEIAAGVRFVTEVDRSRNRPPRTRSASDAGGPR
jgi:hypothetical protein